MFFVQLNLQETHHPNIAAPTFPYPLLPFQPAGTVHTTSEQFSPGIGTAPQQINLCADGGLNRNSSKYLLIPKKQTWLNPPTTVTSLQTMGRGTVGRTES